MNMKYQPPYTITPEILNRVASISEAIGRLTVLTDQMKALRLRRINRIRTIHGSLAIEGNTLSEAQITAILEGKRVIAPPADRVPHLMADLFAWLAATDVHPLITSSVFHYEFEFIHPFADGNGRMGRLWQSLILARWNPLFADIPVESLIFEHQAEYYHVLQESTRQTDSAPFIAFMLRMILDTVMTTAPQVNPQVTPQVGELLAVLQGDMGREMLQSALGLSDRKSFRERYLKPALAGGLIEMTIPDKPNSRLQKYRLTDKGRQWLMQNGGG
jgi:Fic family protein